MNCEGKHECTAGQFCDQGVSHSHGHQGDESVQGWITEPSEETIREVRITVRSRLKRSLEGFPKESRPLSKSAGAVYPPLPLQKPSHPYSKIEHIDNII